MKGEVPCLPHQEICLLYWVFSCSQVGVNTSVYLYTSSPANQSMYYGFLTISDAQNNLKVPE